MKAIHFDMDLISVINRYGTDEQCREYLTGLRWPDGVKCLKCNSESISRITTRNIFECNDCQYQFTTMVGTIFQDSHLALTKWFYATYIMTESRKGISANQLKRMLRVSYKTAWFLCHRIRFAMAEAQGHKLTGTVEIDETYVGGKRKHVGRGSKEGKTPVVGIRERGGHLHFISARHLMQWKMNQLIEQNVDGTVDVIVTDESALYNFKGTKYEGKHKSVNHHNEEYVRYEKGLTVTTNTVESAFSLLKRGIIGSWHKVSYKHLQAYLDEMTWRFNNRKNPYLFRDTMLQLIKSEKIEYKELVKAA